MFRTRMQVRQIAAIALLGLVAACTNPTPYQPATKEGEGYTTQQIETNRFRVSFQGNSVTSRQTVDTYMLYRCAEVTLENGFNYFVIVNRAVDKNTAYEGYGDNLAWGWGGGWGWRHGGAGFGPWGGVSTNYTEPVNSYDAIADIVLYRGTKPANDPYAYDAREVVTAVGPTIMRIAPAPRTSALPVSSPVTGY